jgi:hypothetical protein
MFIATAIVSGLLFLAFIGGGSGKVAANKMAQEQSAHAGFSVTAYRRIGALEVAGAIGLLVGLWWAPLGVAAGIGLALLMAGAVIVHVRIKDPAKMAAPAAVLGLIALAAVILRLASS